MAGSGRTHRWWLGTLSAMLLSGCGGLTPPEGSLAELEQAEARWQATRPLTYRFGIRRDCFCGDEARGPARVTVSGASVTERRYIDTGGLVPAQYEDLFPTVDELFDVLREAIENDAHQITVMYDPGTGVPIELFIDYSLNIADEELGFTVVEAVGPPTG